MGWLSGWQYYIYWPVARENRKLDDRQGHLQCVIYINPPETRIWRTKKYGKNCSISRHF